MRKFIGRLTLIVLLSAFVCCVCIAAHATEDAPVDYTALFDKEATVDGYLAEGYYFEVNQAFHDAPEEFVTALAQRPFSQINSIGFYITTEENSSLSEYKELLSSLDSAFDADSPEYEALYVMKLCAARMDMVSTDALPLAEIRSFYNENNRLFLLCMGEAGDAVQLEYADALVYELSESELTELDDALASNFNADWATEDVKGTIDTFRKRVDEALNPVTPNTEPTTTEPTPTESTAPTAPTSTEGTNPTTSEEQPDDPSSNHWVIPDCASESY